VSDFDPFDDVDETQGDGFTALVAEFGEIGARLRAPRESLDLVGLAGALRRASVVLRLAGWARLAGDFGLPGRLRGTLGNVLVEAASPEARDGRPCRWDPPCAFEALFRKPGRMTPGTDFPSPWVIGVDRRRGDLEVRMTLYGMAVDWLPAAAEALAASIGRVDWAGPSGIFLGEPRPIARRIEAEPAIAVDLETVPRLLVIETLSPLVSSGEGALHDPAAVFTTLGRRLEGLARWQEASLDVDLGALAADCRAADWTWAEAEEVVWRRGSRRQGGREVPMGGVLGRLEIAAEPERLARLAPLLMLGEATRAGADVAFGCGRYRLAVVG
jgi:hypothetical protein